MEEETTTIDCIFTPEDPFDVSLAVEVQSRSLSQINILKGMTPKATVNLRDEGIDNKPLGRSCSWKRLARRQAQRTESYSQEAGESSSRSSSRLHLDFQ